jgi:hypothetical protein
MDSASPAHVGLRSASPTYKTDNAVHVLVNARVDGKVGDVEVSNTPD